MVAIAAPAWADPLYETRVIVTGTGVETRGPALVSALGRVLAKASGNAALRDGARALDPLPLVAAFAYLDRMTDIPVHDEQGTRDRPYDLLVWFDAGRVDAALRGLGAAPWPGPRPVLALDVGIVPRRGGPLALRADTAADERHRGALLAAAGDAGLEVWLPAVAGGVAAPAGAVGLQGRLRWSEEAAGWVAAWRMEWAGVAHEWGSSGTSFDAAYRTGLDGAARLMSGVGR